MQTPGVKQMSQGLVCEPVHWMANQTCINRICLHTVDSTCPHSTCRLLIVCSKTDLNARSWGWEGPGL